MNLEQAPVVVSWVQTFDTFNKIKPKSFAWKFDSTKVTRWKDSIKNEFTVLRVTTVEQQRLVFNLEDSS